MFRKNMYYSNMYNIRRYPRFFRQQNIATFNNNYQNNTINSYKLENNQDLIKEEIMNNSSDETDKKENSRSFNNFSSIFGLNLDIDDIIIILLIILIFMESHSNYNILIVLALMLFNVSFSNFNISV